VRIGTNDVVKELHNQMDEPVVLKNNVSILEYHYGSQIIDNPLVP